MHTKLRKIFSFLIDSTFKLQYPSVDFSTRNTRGKSDDGIHVAKIYWSGQNKNFQKILPQLARFLF